MIVKTLLSPDDKLSVKAPLTSARFVSAHKENGFSIGIECERYSPDTIIRITPQLLYSTNLPSSFLTQTTHSVHDPPITMTQTTSPGVAGLRPIDAVDSALVPMHHAVEAAVAALLIWRRSSSEPPHAIELIEQVLMQDNLLADDAVGIISALRDGSMIEDEQSAKALLEHGNSILAQASELLVHHYTD